MTSLIVIASIAYAIVVIIKLQKKVNALQKQVNELQSPLKKDDKNGQ